MPGDAVAVQPATAEEEGDEAEEATGDNKVVPVPRESNITPLKLLAKLCFLATIVFLALLIFEMYR